MQTPEERTVLISENIHFTRQECGLSREEMVRILDIPLYVLARYENPRANSIPTDDKLDILAQLAGVSKEAFTTALLTEVTPPKNLEQRLLAAAPLRGVVEKRPPPLRAQKKSSKILRTVCLIIIVLAIALSVIARNMKVQLNPKATVTVVGSLFHEKDCPLIEGMEREYYTIEAAYATGHSPCPECIQNNQ